MTWLSKFATRAVQRTNSRLTAENSRLWQKVTAYAAHVDLLTQERDHVNAAATELKRKLHHATDAREALEVRVQDLEQALRLARRHMDTCPTALAVAEEDVAKRRSDQ